MASRDDVIFKARLAEQAERFDEMVEHMKNASETSSAPLTSDERNLLSVAYKNVIGARRASWRVLKALIDEGQTTHPQLAQDYKKKIEEELDERCDEITGLIGTNLMANISIDDEAKVFYLKMQGDYYRYQAEYREAEGRDEARNLSLKAYQAATSTATSKLPPTHPIRLGLALNFSVFYFEIQSDSTQACKIAKDAFDASIAELDSLPEESYKDSTLIMQLLRDNLTLWSQGDKVEE